MRLAPCFGNSTDLWRSAKHGATIITMRSSRPVRLIWDQEGSTRRVHAAPISPEPPYAAGSAGCSLCKLHILAGLATSAKALDVTLLVFGPREYLARCFEVAGVWQAKTVLVRRWRLACVRLGVHTRQTLTALRVAALCPNPMQEPEPMRTARIPP